MSVLDAPPFIRDVDQASRLRALVQSAAAEAPAPPERARPGRTARIIAVASGKGGVGKTSVAVNLSIALARLSHRVTLIDADLGTANADLLCGLLPAARLDQAVRPGGGRRALSEIAIDAPGGFRLVPGSVGVARMADLTAQGRHDLLDAIADLEQTADVIVIDTAAGIGSAVTAFVAAADCALVVTNPEPTAIADAYALIKVTLARPDAPAASPRIVVNGAADAAEAARVHARLAAVAAKFLSADLELAGWIPHDPRVAAAVRARRPLLLGDPRAPASRAMEALALGVSAGLGFAEISDGRRGPFSGLTGLVRRLVAAR